MATINDFTPPYAGNLQGATAFGNMAVLRYVVQTDDKGAFVGGDSHAPLKKDDVINLGILPAGFRIFDSLFIINKPMSGGGAKCGFIYTDGVDDADVPHGVALFHSNINTATPVKLRTAGYASSFSLPKNANLFFTVGEDNAKESFIEIFLYAIVEGAT